MCGGDVRAVDRGVGRGGRLRELPAFHHVFRFPADPQLWPLIHLRSHWHLFLTAGRPTLSPDWPNHQEPLTLGNQKGIVWKSEYIEELMS